jgi:hypothetical protein
VEGEEDDEEEEEEEEELGGTPIQDSHQPRSQRSTDPTSTGRPIDSLSIGTRTLPVTKSNIVPVLYPSCGAGKVKMVRQWIPLTALARTAQV